QAAYQALDYPPRMVYALLDDLYRMGYITYPFTHAHTVPTQVRRALRRYLQANVSAKAVASSDLNEADDSDWETAIIPTDFQCTSDDVPPYLQAIYRLIQQRFLQSEMAPAILCRQSLTLLDADQMYREAHRYQITSDGWPCHEHIDPSLIFGHVEVALGDRVAIDRPRPTMPLTMMDLMRHLLDHHVAPHDIILMAEQLINHQLVTIQANDTCALSPLGDWYATLLTKAGSTFFDPTSYAEWQHVHTSDTDQIIGLRTYRQTLDAVRRGIEQLVNAQRYNERCPQCHGLLWREATERVCLNDLTCGYREPIKRTPVRLKPIQVGDA
ncbi:MAG TPA: DNA topoisomerase, partial [Candidatus Obscuribacterales bacterium]